LKQRRTPARLAQFFSAFIRAHTAWSIVAKAANVSGAVASSPKTAGGVPLCVAMSPALRAAAAGSRAASRTRQPAAFSPNALRRRHHSHQRAPSPIHRLRPSSPFSSSTLKTHWRSDCFLLPITANILNKTKQGSHTLNSPAIPNINVIQAATIAAPNSPFCSALQGRGSRHNTMANGSAVARNIGVAPKGSSNQRQF